MTLPIIIHVSYLPFGARGLALFPFPVIFLRHATKRNDDASRKALIEHELRHVAQIAYWVLAHVVFALALQLFGVSHSLSLFWMAVLGWMNWWVMYGVSGTFRMYMEADAYGKSLVVHALESGGEVDGNKLIDVANNILDTYYDIHRFDVARKPGPAKVFNALSRSYIRWDIRLCAHRKPSQKNTRIKERLREHGARGDY